MQEGGKRHGNRLMDFETLARGELFAAVEQGCRKGCDTISALWESANGEQEDEEGTY